MGTNPDTNVGVVNKTISILTVLSKEPMTVQKCAESAGLSRPTVHRIIKALEDNRFVVRDLLGRFTIGPIPMSWSGTHKPDPLSVSVAQTISELRDYSGDEVLLWWADGVNRICIAATSPLVFGVEVGSRLGASNSSSSLAILAWSPTKRLAVRNIVSTTASEYSSIRRSGWAQATNKSNAITTSAPIRDARNDVVAALTIASDRNKNEVKKWKKHGPQVKTAAAKLSRTLAEHALRLQGPALLPC